MNTENQQVHSPSHTMIPFRDFNIKLFISEEAQKLYYNLYNEISRSFIHGESGVPVGAFKNAWNLIECIIISLWIIFFCDALEPRIFFCEIDMDERYSETVHLQKKRAILFSRKSISGSLGGMDVCIFGKGFGFWRWRFIQMSSVFFVTNFSVKYWIWNISWISIPIFKDF